MLQTTSHGSRHRFQPDRQNYRTMSTVKENPRKRARAKAPRVRTGCKTCKIRHLKCDEGKPHCRRCEKDSHVCDGYEVIQARKSKARKSESPPQESQTLTIRHRETTLAPASPPRLIADVSQLPTGMDLFHHFRTCTVQDLGTALMLAKFPHWLRLPFQTHADDSVLVWPSQKPQDRLASWPQPPSAVSQPDSPSWLWSSAFPYLEDDSPPDRAGSCDHDYAPQPSTSHGLYFTQRPLKQTDLNPQNPCRKACLQWPIVDSSLVVERVGPECWENPSS
ncbi:hypothetical protein EDB80DRAFT_313943 [Ilyonectria destructans]|nr:hypothetical protein EDB80DRAFT_313943 [Ilyonectria destructans]